MESGDFVVLELEFHVGDDLVFEVAQRRGAVGRLVRGEASERFGAAVLELDDVGVDDAVALVVVECLLAAFLGKRCRLDEAVTVHLLVLHQTRNPPREERSKKQRGTRMGVLTEGKPLRWEESLEWLAWVRARGVEEFIALYNKHKDAAKKDFMYGDEIEYGLFDLSDGVPKLSLRGAEVRDLLEEREKAEGVPVEAGKCTWHPEYGAWMVESTPGEPYSGFTEGLRRVEANMRARRARLLAALKDGEVAPTVVVFPTLGADEVEPGPVAASSLVPDSAIHPHPRFQTLTRNIRMRRGDNVRIKVPVFQDAATTEKELELDAMAFGMGCCCLQVTFQCRDVDESTKVYDQLVALAPIVMALSAATPVVAGRLQDHDVRWSVIEQAVDDRTPAERGLLGDDQPRLAGRGTKRIANSRYSAVPAYLAHPTYNDVPLEVDDDALLALKQGLVPDTIANHVAHLFIRDPLVLFDHALSPADDRRLLDDLSTEHFENIQSTNWNTVRWKPPPSPNPNGIGWRVELRSMEVQLTDFENAALTVFATLIIRGLLSFDLSLAMPISKVHDNMRRAHARPDTHQTPSFWWNDADQPLSLGQIVAERLVPLVLNYLDSIHCDPTTRNVVAAYLDFLTRRATGALKTDAQWIRHYVTSHPAYQQDSRITPRIANDLLQACHDIGVGALQVPDLVPTVPPVVKENAYNVQLAVAHVHGQLHKYAKRAQLVTQRDKLLNDIAATTLHLTHLHTQLHQLNLDLATAL